MKKHDTITCINQETCVSIKETFNMSCITLKTNMHVINSRHIEDNQYVTKYKLHREHLYFQINIHQLARDVGISTQPLKLLLYILIVGHPWYRDMNPQG